MFQTALRLFNAKALSTIAVVLAMSFFTPAHSAPVPTDEEQEILVKTTLMTFNDANLTGNYSVLNLKGKFKDDDKRIRFDLKFVHEVGAWKLVGINVNYKEE